MKESNRVPSDAKAPEYVSISLAISSDRIEPEAITLRLGLQPSHSRLRGTPIRNGMMRRPEFDLHEWSIRKELPLLSGILTQEEAEPFISDFLRQFAAVENGVRTLSEEHDVVVVLVYSMKYIPYIGLTCDQIHTLSRLGARLDYDLMVDTL